ncbi:GNAT family N-acetyltransferase [Brachybacterium sp. AOP43-C2-M15]|uniref:GNAT family N-acetyltransferase n=1 Tax=Brachybacterium sp. AOP43-C2-M15 TaxID=3457661 RepID=UPI0040341282
MHPAFRLVAPSVHRYPAFVDCIADFAGTPMDGSGITDPGRAPLADGDFIDYVTERLAEEDPTTELEPGRVHCSSRWILEEGTEELLGFLAIRHRLTPHLLDQGGHIGFSVRPSARRRGVASRALALGLEQARERGIHPVLITCDDENLGSQRTIERNGGALEDVREGTRRYWIDGAPRPTASA